MPSCQCEGIEVVFDEKMAQKEMKAYRRKGPKGFTRELIDYLKAQGVAGKSLLDIGGGLGAIQHELVAADLAMVTNVDGSSAYLAICKEEAELRGYADKATYHHGNFVELADQIEPADIVTLDKVLCCFDDVDSLVKLSAAKAKQFYAVVYPRNKWWLGVFRVGAKILSAIKGTTFSFFPHSSEHVDQMIKDAGFNQTHYAQNFVWQLVIYNR